MSKGVGVSVAKSSKKAAPKKKARPATKAKTSRTVARKSPASSSGKSTAAGSASAKSKAPQKQPAKKLKKTPPVKKSPAPRLVKIAPKIAPLAKTANGKTMSSKPSSKSTNSKPAENKPGSSKITSIKPANGKPAKAASAPPEIIPPPAPPRLKPAKNLAGLSLKELETFRDMLFAKRRELVGDMYSMEREALQRSGENLSNLPMHMADMGTDNYEQEFTLGLMEKDRQLLREINQALSKIMDGRYGICEGTGKPISKARLEVQPWAKYSIEHARKLENRGVR